MSKKWKKNEENHMSCRAVIDNSNPDDYVFIPSDLYLDLSP